MSHALSHLSYCLIFQVQHCFAFMKYHLVNWLSIPGIDRGHFAFCLYDAFFYNVSSLKWTNLLSVSIVEICNARIKINSCGKQFNKHYREIHYRCHLYWKDACLKWVNFIGTNLREEIISNSPVKKIFFFEKSEYSLQRIHYYSTA